MKKLWSQLAPRTQRRYKAQGVTGSRYNAANKRGLRGEARAAFLNIDRAKISGPSQRDAFAVVRAAILLRRPEGTRVAWGKDAGPIRWEKVRDRINKLDDDAKRHVRKSPRFSTWDDYVDWMDEYADWGDDYPLWYND